MIEFGDANAGMTFMKTDVEVRTGRQEVLERAEPQRNRLMGFTPASVVYGNGRSRVSS